MAKKKKKSKSEIIVLIAACGIIWLESIALFKGIDGTILTMSISALAGLGGYYLKKHRG